MSRFKPARKRIALVLVLAWLLIALASPLMPAWSQTTYTVEYYPIDDAYVDNDNPDTNYGLETTLNFKENTYVKFNLTDFSLPVERIVSAKLKFYVIDAYTSDSSNYVMVEYAYDNWDEETITYNSRPGRDSSLVLKYYITCENCWVEFDVTSIVSQKLSETDKILSFWLYRSGSTCVVYSKDAAESQYWPRLVIEYEPYTETQTQTITETVTITETATETITETQMTTTTVTDYVTETQIITTTATDTVYTTETAYTTQTVTTTQTITDVITETATATTTQTETIWANETVTVTTTITPTTTVTEYGNSTASEINYQALADALMPIIMVVGVICTMLSLILSATSSRRGD